MAKPEPPHNGMQTVTFTCAKGDTHTVHGHTAHAFHHHEVRRVRASLARGCTAKKLKPGVVHGKTKDPTAIRGVACGAPIVEKAVNHETPARVEPVLEEKAHEPHAEEMAEAIREGDATT